jgi:hypothetical protein
MFFLSLDYLEEAVEKWALSILLRPKSLEV